MGIPFSGSRDLATARSDVSFTAPAQVTDNVSVHGAFNLTIYGTGTGSFVAEKSFDGGTTWVAAVDQAGVTITFAAAASRALFEPEAGVLWRLRAASITGTVGARVSQ
jgi:hypothetical protein